MPVARAFTRMPATQDVEIMLGWRFQRAGTGVGSRFETTAWMVLDHPLDSVRGGVETTPALLGAVVTGYASRSVYAWAGGAYGRSARTSGPAADEGGDVRMASLVLGYRPRAFRGEFPAADWRAFVEVVGEWMGRDRMAGAVVEDSGGSQVFVGVTLLGLYGSWGLSGGPAVPVHQRLGAPGATERVRFALNATFWF